MYFYESICILSIFHYILYVCKQILLLQDKNLNLGRPGGAVVKCACSASGRPEVRRFGSQVRTWHCLARHAVVGIPHIKWRKMGTDFSSGPGSLSKKRRNGSSYLRDNLPQKKKKNLNLHISIKEQNFMSLFIMIQLKIY